MGGIPTSNHQEEGWFNIAISTLNYNNLTVTKPWESYVFYREIIPLYGRTIQVSEIFQFAQIGGFPDTWDSVINMLVI